MAKAPSIAKVIKWTINADETFTAKMEWLKRADTVTVKTYEDAVKTEDLFRFFGIDSAKAGKPLQSDIELLAARKAAREAVR